MRGSNWERIMAEPCSCGAQPGERCRPTNVVIGYHAGRLARAGVPLLSSIPRPLSPEEYARSVRRSPHR